MLLGISFFSAGYVPVDQLLELYFCIKKIQNAWQLFCQKIKLFSAWRFAGTGEFVLLHVLSCCAPKQH